MMNKIYIQDVTDLSGNSDDAPTIINPSSCGTTLIDATSLPPHNHDDLYYRKSYIDDMEGPQGDNGWTAEISAVPRGEDEEVLKVIDWFGGEGVKPPLDLYVSDIGFTDDINLATNVKGDKFVFADFTPEQLESLKVKGDDGDDAFEVWLRDNPTGTYEDWEAYLQAPALEAAQQVEDLIDTSTTILDSTIIARDEAIEATINANAAIDDVENIIEETQVAITNADIATTNADAATTNANIAATNANDKAGLAQTATTNANAAASTANTAATNADNKATLANNAANTANTATTNANNAATAANTATTNANTATTQANTARDSANAAAIVANNARGWSPLFVGEADGIDREVWKLNSWINGTGTTPTDNVGLYLKSDGTYTAVKADAANYKGEKGNNGIATPNINAGKLVGRTTVGFGSAEELAPVGLTLDTGQVIVNYQNAVTAYNASLGVNAILTNDMSGVEMFQNLQKQVDSRIVNTGSSTNLVLGDGTYQALLTLPAFTATKLLTPCNINGVAFDGTANITIADATKIPTSEKGANNGVATLDSGGKIPSSQLPAIAITDTFLVASQAAMLALTAQVGDVAIRSDISKTFILRVEPATTLGNWSELLNPTDAVTSVAGKTGVVTLVKADVGLSNVDNTADTAKPVSTAQQTALNLKANLASPTFTGTPALPTGTIAVKQTVGNNTTAVATTSFVAEGLALKAPLASPTFTGTVSGITAAMVGAPSGSGTSTGTNTGDQTWTTLSGKPTFATVATTGAYADLSGTPSLAGYAPLASPTFTGTPTLPTGTIAVKQALRDNTTALATTSFVQEATRYAAITAVAANVTLALTDENTYVRISGTRNITVPPNSTVAFPIGARIDFLATASAIGTFVQGAGVTIISKTNLILTGFGACTLIKTGTDTWDLIGNN